MHKRDEDMAREIDVPDINELCGRRAKHKTGISIVSELSERVFWVFGSSSARHTTLLNRPSSRNHGMAVDYIISTADLGPGMCPAKNGLY